MTKSLGVLRILKLARAIADAAWSELIFGSMIVKTQIWVFGIFPGSWYTPYSSIISINRGKGPERHNKSQICCFDHERVE